MLITRISVLVMSAAFLAGCASTQSESPLLFHTPGEQIDSEAADDLTPQSATVEDIDSRPEPIEFRGSDVVVELPEGETIRQYSGEKVALGFENAPLNEVVHAIMGDVLELDYSIDRPLQGDITLHTRAPVPSEQLLPILESMLQANGAVMVKGNDGIYHIGPEDSVRSISSGITDLEQMPAGFSTVIVPLEYIGAEQMREILAQIAPQSAFLRVDRTRNLLMLAGTRGQIEGWMEIVQSFDINMLDGMSVGIYPIMHAPVDEVVSAVNMLLNEQSQADMSGPVRVMAIERLNSVLVVTPRSQFLDAIGTWIERLDREPENDFESQLYVYPVQNGNATHLAGLLSSVFDGVGGVSASTTGSTDSGVAPGMETSTIADSAEEEEGGSASATDSQAASPARDSSTNLGGGSRFGEGVRVVPDEVNNALLIYAPRRDYRKIENALRSLDVSPTQVLIEASILEITLADELRYGLEWFLSGSIGSRHEGSGVLNLSNEGGISGRQPGFSFSVTNPANEIRAVLNALAEKQLLQVVSTPSIMVLDNHTAKIQVGDQQPIRSRQTVTDGGTTSSSIEYKDTGVLLSVTPSVNAGGMVAMDLEQSVTDVGQVDQATEQRSFMQRDIQTQVAIRSGETVVLGGLIRNNNTNSRSGLPFLHDLPGIGNLFGGTSITSNRTELLVMITPRVMQSDEEIRAVSREMRDRLKGLRALPGWNDEKIDEENR